MGLESDTVSSLSWGAFFCLFVCQVMVKKQPAILWKMPNYK